MASEPRLPLILGESPSERGDRYHAFPLSGPPARTLCKAAGIEPAADGSSYGRWTWALYERFDCVNLFRRHAQAAPWSVPRAREQAAALAERGLFDGRTVVCLGRRVQTALHQAFGLGVPLVPFYEWRCGQDGEPAAWAAIPHPSGRNRLLNDPAEHERVGDALRRAMAVTPA